MLVSQRSLLFNSFGNSIRPSLPLIAPQNLPIEPKIIGTNTSIVESVLVPSIERLIVKEDPTSGQPTKHLPSIKRQTLLCKTRFSMNMLRIRRRKMKKHQLRKFRKRMLAHILKQRQKREIRKEKLFRAELLSKIRAAEQFDAKQFVHNMLSTIKNAPRSESKKERLDKVFNLIREHRKETVLIRPKFDDPAPEK